MSKVIGEVNLKPSRIEGTPAYHIFGLALSQLAEFHSTKSLDKAVSVTLHNLLHQLKKERNELKN